MRKPGGKKLLGRQRLARDGYIEMGAREVLSQGRVTVAFVSAAMNLQGPYERGLIWVDKNVSARLQWVCNTQAY